jgi:hypothetical protein
MAGHRNFSDYLQTIPAITWLIVIFALLVLAGGFTAMAVFGRTVDAGVVTALVTAVLGVVGTHIGHVTGHDLATKSAAPAKSAGPTASPAGPQTGQASPAPIMHS